MSKRRERDRGGDGGGESSAPPAPAKKDLWALLEESKNIEGTLAVEPQIDTHVLVVGSRQAGKSTLIDRFIRKESKKEEAIPTNGLKYTYGRKESGTALRMGHFWEIGGGDSLVELVDVVITPENVENFVGVIVLDLSQPPTVMRTLLMWINRIRARATECVERASATDGQLGQRLVTKMMGWLNGNPDLARIRPSLVPVIVVANKYDQFKTRDNPDEHQILGRALRYACHYFGAALCTTDVTDSLTMASYRKLMSRYVFDVTSRDSSHSDPRKPMFIPIGCDSVADIGVVPAPDEDELNWLRRHPDQKEDKTEDEDLNGWCQIFVVVFPKSIKKKGDKQGAGSSAAAASDTHWMDTVDDGGTFFVESPDYSEPIIDSVRSQKEVELDRYRIRQGVSK